MPINIPRKQAGDPLSHLEFNTLLDFIDLLEAGGDILNGSGVPTTTLGKVGDYYIDNATTTIYGPKVLDNWGDGVPLVDTAESIQLKRPLKTLNNISIEGEGNINLANAIIASEIPEKVLIVDQTGNGIETGGILYKPNIVINPITIPNKDVSTTFQLTLTGVFIDAINSIVLSAPDDTGLSINQIKKTFNELILDITVNDTVQQYTLSLIGSYNSVSVSFDTQAVVNNVFIPDPTGTGERLWVSPNGSGNNAAILTIGGFESPEEVGTGFDDHGYYGSFTATEVVHKYIIDRVIPVDPTFSVLASMRFTNDNTAGNTGIRMYFYIDGSGNPICRFHHLNGIVSLSDSSLAIGDEFEIRFTASSVEIRKNNILLGSNNTEDFTSCVSGSFVTLTAYRTLKLTGISTEIIP